jgi:hypothetical protein
LNESQTLTLTVLCSRGRSVEHRAISVDAYGPCSLLRQRRSQQAVSTSEIQDSLAINGANQIPDALLLERFSDRPEGRRTPPRVRARSRRRVQRQA